MLADVTDVGSLYTVLFKQHWNTVKAVLSLKRECVRHVYELTSMPRGRWDGGGLTRQKGCQANDHSSTKLFNISKYETNGFF